MAGLKHSRQREAILDYLHSTKSHPTAEAVYWKVREEFPKISLGTVYRNLNLLANQGQVLRLQCGDGVEHFDGTGRRELSGRDPGSRDLFLWNLW